jgi:hypothetical protein
MPFDGLHASTALSAPAIIHRGRWCTGDALQTYDAQRTYDASGNHLGRSFGQSYRSWDGKYYDSTGAFLLGELVRLDQTTHLPLASVSWGRDIDLRQDVTVADDATSWTLSTFGSPGGLGMSNAITGGKAWVGKATTEIASVDVDIALQTRPLRPYALEVKYTVFELESALRLGRPIDAQRYEGLRLKHQMDIDAQVYAGDSDTGDRGLVNQPLATTTTPGAGTITNLPTGNWMAGATTPAMILADFNFALNQTWQASAWAVVPSRVLIPPAQYGALATQLVSTAGTTSILRYVEENNLLSRSGQGKLEIYPSKWCIGAGAGGTIGTAGPGTTDRMVVYTKSPQYLRYPMTLLARTPLQYDGIWQKSAYYSKLGVLEIIYPEVLAYYDRV